METFITIFMLGLEDYGPIDPHSGTLLRLAASSPVSLSVCLSVCSFDNIVSYGIDDYGDVRFERTARCLLVSIWP